MLSDLNRELIDLYRGIRRSPTEVWDLYSSYPATKATFQTVRAADTSGMLLAERAGRLLYLNRTCFKGNWRQNARGEFNVGYGGQSRRNVISLDYLLDVSRALRKAKLHCGDFEEIIDQTRAGDFIFADPPYRPGERELINDHYVARRFSFVDHERLAHALHRASKRGVRWALTTSMHPDLLDLFPGDSARRIERGTRCPGDEVLITN